MAVIGAGELRHRIALETRNQAAAGGAAGVDLTDAYTVAANAWAKIEGLRGGRYIAGKQTEEVATHRLTIRWRDGYTAWTHASEGTRRWRIHSVADRDGRREWLEMECEELTP